MKIQLFFQSGNELERYKSECSKVCASDETEIKMTEFYFKKLIPGKTFISNGVCLEVVLREKQMLLVKII